MKKYVIITGGQLENKGAQAMTFITVTQAKRLFPDCDVVLLSNYDANRSSEEKQKYNFIIQRFPSLHFPFEIPLYLYGPTQKEFKDLFRNAVCLFDISGYRLGSNWGIKKTLTYCGSILLAKRFHVPVYIMPQSFGPFRYREYFGVFHHSVMRIIRKALSYSKVIMARENDGKKLLEEKFGLTNVVKTSDMVLQSPPADPAAVYRMLPSLRTIDVEKDSVALIPNSKNNQYGDADKVYRLYNRIIGFLLDNGKRVYLIYHSINDKEICAKLKNTFAENDRVVLIDQELSCIEYSMNISKFDYIIASRYHSIIHAYKERVPALIIGWAIKYQDLASDFHQDQFCVNVAELNEDEIIKRLSVLNSEFREQSAVIGEGLKAMEQHNVFDYIG